MSKEAKESVNSNWAFNKCEYQYFNTIQNHCNNYIQVLKNNESTSGITFHYVNENYDEGQIISQFEVSLSQEETLVSLKHKIDVLEKKHYPLVISSILNE